MEAAASADCNAKSGLHEKRFDSWARLAYFLHKNEPKHEHVSRLNSSR